MLFNKLAGACLLALSSFATANSIPRRNDLWGEDRMGDMVRRQASSSTSSATSTSSLVADSSCTNSPTTRDCWSDGYSIATDFDQKHPTTGVTRTYSLEITNTTCNPDGAADVQCFLLNGQYPGPLIEADWGDMLEITVTNSMQNNGTSIHWHGIRQLNSCGSDGVNGVTECALAPGTTKTYTFQATQFGTSWYHSHYSSQYGSGIIGTIIINGPATSNYDIDLGTFPIGDWYYQTAEQINVEALENSQLGLGPPDADATLVNGTSKSASGGSYAGVTLTAGKKHRLRIINTSVDNFWYFKLDSHDLTVISADFIPIEPITGQDWILIAIGQRYDVIIEANQTSGNYWFRAETATVCLSAGQGTGRALFTYNGTDVSEPTDDDEAAPDTSCTELNTIPYWDQSVDSDTFASQVHTLEQGYGNGTTITGENLVLWNLNVTSMTVHWDDPTLQYVFDDNTTYPASLDIIEIPDEGVWTYWVIQEVSTAPAIPHPIHLHGHDFFVLGSAAGATFDVSTDMDSLNFVNPPRRDTTILPAGGWLVVAFMANNPGAWLMHCHIAWHISEGLGVQFLEAVGSIVLPDETDFNTQCTNWRSYAPTMVWPQIDSGI